MRRTPFVICAFLTVAMTLVPGVQAKGPTKATIEGPGLQGSIQFTGNSESEQLSRFGEFAEAVGFFPGAFGQAPSPMLAGRPRGDLGPRYTITWRVPTGAGADSIHQDVYPYASHGTVSFMPAGQPFFGTQRTRGGWYQAAPTVKQTLVALGLPATRPKTDGRRDRAAAIGLGGAAVVLLAVLGVATIRRRPRARRAPHDTTANAGG
ncbi:MAG: hypothetical protein ABR583_10800 [Gaiellaceae bacterium]